MASVLDGWGMMECRLLVGTKLGHVAGGRSKDLVQWCHWHWALMSRSSLLLVSYQALTQYAMYFDTLHRNACSPGYVKRWCKNRVWRMNDWEFMFPLVFMTLSWQLYQLHHSSHAVATIMMKHTSNMKGHFTHIELELASTEGIISQRKKLTANIEGVFLENACLQAGLAKSSLGTTRVICFLRYIKGSPKWESKPETSETCGGRTFTFHRKLRGLK